MEAEAARLRGEPAPELWQAAVDGFAFGHVYEQARSRWRLAEALLAAGDRRGPPSRRGRRTRWRCG